MQINKAIAANISCMQKEKENMQKKLLYFLFKNFITSRTKITKKERSTYIQFIL